MKRLCPTDFSTSEFIEIMACATVFAEQQGEAHERLRWEQIGQYRCPEMQEAYLNGRAKEAARIAKAIEEAA